MLICLKVIPFVSVGHRLSFCGIWRYFINLKTFEYWKSICIRNWDMKYFNGLIQPKILNALNIHCTADIWIRPVRHKRARRYTFAGFRTYLCATERQSVMMWIVQWNTTEHSVFSRLSFEYVCIRFITAPELLLFIFVFVHQQIFFFVIWFFNRFSFCFKVNVEFL